jgi:uncharacterized protein YbbC (DUF1343 family)
VAQKYVFPGYRPSLDRAVAEPPDTCLCHGLSWSGIMGRNIEPDKYQPYITTLRLLQAVIFHHRDRFKWKLPPYEYEFERIPIDLITGDKEIRQRIENFDNIDEMAASWKDDLDEFVKTSRRFYLYS